ncbi:PEP-CTERM sorting domain-containing protein [Aurantiacibacter sp. MUD61]|uniref:PEP-CTERM sorting domain-containing protein n=1 Tax=Aurantiacibacter sp. MUD61 TaxID=3009083 RepID=UPI0022F0F791|nr:PEP-CTERM sorting domain-containing protein [Aurantiacibacter sp. MUD61]
MLTRLFLAIFALTASAPAYAATPAQIPEGSSATLFALGVLGVIIGRRLSMRKSDGEED